MDDLLDLARRGDRRALAKLVTALEDDRADSSGLLPELWKSGGSARVIGLTGAPGAGKSTLLSGLVSVIRSVQRTVAVVAIDPTSPYTGGALLGDRIRMQAHIDDPGVFVRSMATRGHLGGLAAATTKVVALLDAVGFDVVLVETVGVGQAEVEIADSAHSTVVVVSPGFGDSVQANKAGVLEVADVLVVNKSDVEGADRAVAELEGMLELGPVAPSGGWVPPIVRTTATTGEGVGDVWAALERHAEEVTDEPLHRIKAAMHQALAEQLTAGPGSDDFEQLATEVAGRQLDPWTAAERLAARQ